MTVANGRNNMLSSIEDSASLLCSLIDELNEFYSCKMADFEKEVELLRKGNPQEDPEVLNSMCSDLNYVKSIYGELFMETKEMLISKVYSYAEKHLNELLSMLGYNRKKILEEYKKNNTSIHGISDIDKCCYILQTHYELEPNLLYAYWPNFKIFHELRKSVEHRYAHNNTTIDIEMIKNNLDKALHLLKRIELATREKRRS